MHKRVPLTSYYFIWRKPTERSSFKHSSSSSSSFVLTLVTADAFEADAAVTGSRHVVTRGVVHALTQLLAAVTERPRGTLWTGERRVNASFHITVVMCNHVLFCLQSHTWNYVDVFKGKSLSFTLYFVFFYFITYVKTRFTYVDEDRRSSRSYTGMPCLFFWYSRDVKNDNVVLHPSALQIILWWHEDIDGIKAQPS